MCAQNKIVCIMQALNSRWVAIRYHIWCYYWFDKNMFTFMGKHIIAYHRKCFCPISFCRIIFFDYINVLIFHQCRIIRLKLSSTTLRFVKLYRITQDDRCCELFYRCSSRTKFAPMWIMKPRLLQFIFTSHAHFKDTMHYHAKSIQLSNDHEQPNAICLKEIRIFYHDAKLFLMLRY